MRAGDPAYLVADISKAANMLGWRPRYSDINFIVRSAFAYSNLRLDKLRRDEAAFLKEPFDTPDYSPIARRATQDD